LNQAPRKAHFEDHEWINDDQKKQINGKSSNGRRSTPLAQHHQELQMKKQPMYNYPDHQPRNGQQRNFDGSSNKQHRMFVLFKIFFFRKKIIENFFF
jgi:hypothetical protein